MLSTSPKNLHRKKTGTAGLKFFISQMPFMILNGQEKIYGNNEQYV